jgi:flagellin-like protein
MKGLSPIVASVILIATTMAIAGILSFWAGSFVEKKVGESENTTTDISCLNARFSLFTQCKYNEQTKEISFILENQATQDIILDSLYVFYPGNNLKQYKLSLKIQANQLRPFNQSGIEPGFIGFQLRTTCPNVYREFNCTE